MALGTAPVGAEISPEKEAMMQAMKAAGEVTEHHKSLEYLEGEWKTVATWWPQPGAKPEKSEGMTRFQKKLDGRFMQESMEGTMMNQPFVGLGYHGYDNVKKKFVTIWKDNMSTSVFRFEGDYADKRRKVIETTSEFTCPMMGNPKMVRAIMKKVNDKKVIYEHYEKTAEGKEYKSMEVVYTKQL